MNIFAKIIVSLGGFGFIKPASGTIGSAVSGLVLYFFWPELALIWKGLIILLTFLIGCYLSDLIERNGKLHDPHFVVIDEAVGMMITGLFLGQVWQHWIIAFFLFRFFDIAKIWPASYYDKKPGGFAIMFDDVIMALPALLFLSLIISFIY
jgi:phosphatidylglycerophosphatase A